ncbi:MFS transporter [Cerasicoccus fimbriatus]|uniref:MFS transporter n=1 Tax=Cerasicoccus fimbriatus TaxID=3014554 RepID=UPI0022B5B59C|nr:MFS transporter [Cerasicoccus sp. TK19100]
MASALLILIYIAFISLGLPDAVLGAGWPAMQSEFGVAYGLAGLVHMITAGGTIISSMLAGTMLTRFGTGKVTACSVGLTAVALLGFSLSPSFWWLPLAAVPLGLGAGAVDAGLNAFVAANYESRHMSWLHCFWGVGALSGPLILSSSLLAGHTWRFGYLSIAVLQFVLVGVLLATLRLWGMVGSGEEPDEPTNGDSSARSFLYPLRLKGAKSALVTFLLYCGIESTMGLWGGSFLFKIKGCDPASAARWVSLFFASITLGRFLTGFVTIRFSNDALIRAGCLTVLVGIALMLLPLPLPFALAGFALIGLGCAPIFPCMLHETPARFGKSNAQMLMGVQMAVAYVGATFLPPLFGFLAASTTLAMLPALLLAYAVVMLFAAERTSVQCQDAN